MAVLRWQLAGMRVVLVTVMPKDPWHVDFGDRNLVIEHGNGKSMEIPMFHRLNMVKFMV